MPLHIPIELEDGDLQYFIDAMQRAQAKTANFTAQQVTAAAQKLLTESAQIQAPRFIVERLANLESMVDMVNDAGWCLPDEDQQRVLSALAYFADPDDVIPDHVPVLGFLDDAIVIELCRHELQHELEAYGDFCDYRQQEARRRGEDAAQLKLERVEWLESRRVELLDRMRKRRRESYSNVSSWRPTLFKCG